MKLRLDRNKRPFLNGFGAWFYLALICVCAWVVILEAPVFWFAGALGSQTHCRLVVQQPEGSLWQGSAAIGFSEPNLQDGGCRPPIAVTERFRWNASCRLLKGFCQGSIQFSALDQPLGVRWGFGGLQIGAGEVKLPANVLEGLGSPWSTLRPRGEMGIRWTDLDFWGEDQKGSNGVVRIIISNLSSPISPVKPLGAYEIGVNLVADGGSWSLTTTNGPLILRGTGDFGKTGVHFSGDVSSSPEAKESLFGLVSLLGKKEGDTYRVQF